MRTLPGEKCPECGTETMVVEREESQVTGPAYLRCTTCETRVVEPRT